MPDKKKVSLSEKNSRILMIEMNKIIERIADEKTKYIISGKIQTSLAYPPNNGFNTKESAFIQKLITNDEDGLNALRKILADSIACGVFDLFNLIDGTADPELDSWEKDGISLIDKDGSIEDNNEMLHDSLFEKYWDWQEMRNEDWKLDTIEE
ncbi:MAG: hypothetical protein GX654_16165 [Desulfatiglans sp.]|jgi:hypothetical protein|nr:hypothetical protein [Desulfatiglans sp.]